MAIDVRSPLSAHYVVLPTNASANPNVEYSIVDRLDGQVIQPVATKKPVLVWSNGVPCLRFSQDNCILIPLKAANNATHRFGFACWVKRQVNSVEVICSIDVGASGASVSKCYLLLDQTNTAAAYWYTTNADLRISETPNNACRTGVWEFVAWLFDGDGANESDRERIIVNGVPQVMTYIVGGGAGTAVTRLRAPTGNIVIGNFNNGAAVQAFRGDLGPDLYFFNDVPTMSQLDAFMNLRRPGP